MSILTAPLPQSVEINGVQMPLRTSFANWMQIDAYLVCGGITIFENAADIFKLAFNTTNPPPNFKGAMLAIAEFYSGAIEKEPRHESADGKINRPKRIYSFEHDASYIYAAFLSQYGIDLIENASLHWWKFKALFEALNEQQKITKIMEYRAMDLSKIKDKKQRAQYRRLQQLYALPDMRSDEQKEIDMINELEKMF